MGTAVDQASGTSVATGTLDDDGNAVFVFKGASCAAGDSVVTADVDAGTHPTYTTTFTVDAPAPTVATTMKMTSSTKSHRRHHRKPKGGRGSGSATGDPPAITVTASPNPLVETGEGPPPVAPTD